MLNKFRFKDFNWSEELVERGKTDKKQFGLVAQDVEKIISKFVGGDEGGKHIKYNKFTPYLMKAIQELSAKVEALENA
jgi:hypothetical protein